LQLREIDAVRNCPDVYLLVGREAARIPHRPDRIVTLGPAESKAILAGVWPPDGVDTREGNREHLPPNR